MKRALEHRLRHLEADEALIRLRLVPAGRDLHDVERELDEHVRRRRVGVGDRVPIPRAQLRIHQRHRSVHRFRVADVVGGIVRQRAEREGVLGQVLASRIIASTKSPVLT